MKTTFKEFVEGIKKQAEVLRRHGLLDPADRTHEARKYKRKEEEREPTAEELEKMAAE